MMTITKIQAQIIEKLVSNNKKIPDTGEYGLTNSALCKDGELVRRTFQLNREFLEKHQLIKLVKMENHGDNDRKWRYYDATLFGLIEYLKQVSVQELERKMSVKQIKRFFPIISNYWDELYKLYGRSLFFIFKRSLDQIQIRPFTSYITGKPFFSNRKSNWWLEELTTLDFSNFSITFRRQYTTLSDEKWKAVEMKLEDHGIKLPSNFDRIEVDALHRLTFLLFFNLHSLEYDAVLRQHVSNFLGYKPDKYNEKIQGTSDMIIVLIKKDPILRNIFEKTLMEILPKFHDLPKSIDMLRRIGRQA